MKELKDFVILPHNATRIKGHYLVSNMLGGWDFLEPGEFKEFEGFKLRPGTDLFDRLRKCGLIADEKNMGDLITGFRSLNNNLFLDTSLHIAVVTTRCNLSCSYCQAKTVPSQDMSPEVASRVLKYLFDGKAYRLALEFQGGEPLLNWPVVRMLIQGARQANFEDRELKIALVSNLLPLDDEKMQVLAENNVQVCSSLDGPQDIHDANRKDAGEEGTYQKVSKKAAEFERKFGQKVRFLPTITQRSLSRYKDIVDEYVQRGQPEVCLRPVNNMGSACAVWGDLGYEPEEFCKFYAHSLDYILSLNARGVKITERTTRVILTKVLLKTDPGFVDMMNPCGAGRATMAYMPDGSCYPCDEARMLNEDMFRLGNILHEQYEDMIKKDELLQLLHSSCTNLWHYGSAFSPWMGFCPAVNYALQKNVVPRAACSPAQKIQEFQFRYIFEKMLEGGETLKILKSWVTKGAS